MHDAYDLAVAWSWEYDAAFVAALARACAERGVSMVEITPATLGAAATALERGELELRALLDRASDTDERFLALVDWCRRHGARLINDRQHAERAWDKATMHLEFIAAGVHTPYTVVLAPYAEWPGRPPPDLSQLGDRFILKPAHGGGGIGVVRNLSTWEQIQHVRRLHPAEKYLAQAWVTASLTSDGPAWFRVFSAAGEIIPFWWGVTSHVFRPVTQEEETRHGFAPLRDVVRHIAAVCRLDLFSTEIARRDADGAFVSVDYVNDPVDLRPRSGALDGIPDESMHVIAARIAALAAESS